MPRAIVIGAGLAGLTASVRLARAGWAVTTLEASATLGGRARTRSLDGFHLNLGPHALYLDGHAARLFRSLDLPLPGRPPSARGYLLTSRGPARLPSTPWDVLTTRALSARDKLALLQVFAALPRLSTDGLTGTLSDWLSARVPRPRVRAILEVFVRLATYVDPPGALPASLALRQLQVALRGVLYVDEGWGTLVRGLEQLARAAGVTILPDHPARALRHEGGRAQGVETPHRAFAADAVVLALGPRPSARLLGVESPEVVRPQRAACLDVALRGPLRPRTTFALGLDVPHYVSVHSRSARVAPPGDLLVHVARYLPTDDPGLKVSRDALEAVLDPLIPGWRAQVVHARFAPQLTVVEDVSFNARAPVQVEGFDNVYRCGDWVGARGWLADASVASAEEAAAAVRAAVSV